MKCSNCSIDIPKEFKMALQKNVCPSCGKPILATGNSAAFVPLCELIDGAFELNKKTPDTAEIEFDQGEVPMPEEQNQQKNVEDLATLILTTFNVRLKSERDVVEVKNNSSDAPQRQKQIDDSKSILAQMREEAYNDAVRKQWFPTPDGEEQLDPDVGEMLMTQVGGEEQKTAGQILIDRKQEMARQNLLNGTGIIRRSGS